MSESQARMDYSREVFAGRCRGCGRSLVLHAEARANKLCGIDGLRLRCGDETCRGTAFGWADAQGTTRESPPWFLDREVAAERDDVVRFDGGGARGD